MPGDKYAADGLRDYRGPIYRHFGHFPAPVAGLKDAWRAEEVNLYLIRSSWAVSTENALMNVIDELKKNYEAAKQLWDAYNTRLLEFRSIVKNDITSLEAGARRTTDAVAKMNKAYGEVILQLNGPEMTKAIENAERLAKAMESLANLQSHKLTFAVIDAQASKS